MRKELGETGRMQSSVINLIKSIYPRNFFS